MVNHDSHYHVLKFIFQSVIYTGHALYISSSGVTGCGKKVCDPGTPNAKILGLMVKIFHVHAFFI